MADAVRDVTVENLLRTKDVQTTVAHEAYSIVFGSITEQMRHVTDVYIVKSLRVWVTEKQKINVVFPFLMLTQKFDTETLVVRVEGDDVDANVGVLVLEFGNIFHLDREGNIVKVESIYVWKIVGNATGVAFRRVETG